MGNTSNISAWWKNLTVFISQINNPAVAWETNCEEVYQLTPEVLATESAEAVPATYRLNVYPVDLNDPGADNIDVEIGYKLMDYIGQVYEVIAVSEDKKVIDVADILLCGYCPPSGRPALIFNDSSQGTTPPPKPFESRWVVVSKTCLLDEELHNTGEQEVVSKKQKLEGATWEDTGETTKNIVTNHADCPPPQPPAPDPYRAAQFVGLVWDANSAQEISFTVGVMKKINTMTAAGNNYLFLSIPTALSFSVADGTGVDITDMFVSVGTDNKTGYQPNTVWRKNPKYSSGAVLKIHLTIY